MTDKMVQLVAAKRFDGLEGKVKRGQELEVSEDRARELIRAGLAAKPGEDAGQGGGGEPLHLVTSEDQAKLDAARVKAEQDAKLAPYVKGGGYYEFPALEEGSDPVKVRGREAALAELARREAAGDAGQPASGE